MKNIIYFFILISIVCSCGPKVVYEDTVLLPQYWSYEEPIIFDAFDISDPNQKYDLMLVVKHDAEYKYQNFYTQVKTVFPDETERTDPISIELANKMGTWLSDCSGTSCTLYLVLRDNVKFKDKGKYQLTFVQDTREQKLEGLQSMELKLIEAD